MEVALLGLQVDERDSYAARHVEHCKLTFFDEPTLSLTLEQKEACGGDDDDMQSAVWPSCELLCRALQDDTTIVSRRWWQERKRMVIELGSGCGGCGIFAAKLGADKVILTDYPQLLPLLTRNASLNGVEASVKVLPLEWGVDEADAFVEGLPAESSQTPIDMILGSDVTAFVQTLDVLEATIHRLATAEHTQVLLAHLDRNDAHFVLETFEKRFTIERLVPAWQHSPKHMLFRMLKRRQKVEEEKEQEVDEEEEDDPLSMPEGEALIQAAAARGSAEDLAELKRRLRTGAGGGG